jgi:hypothetical protein
MSMDGNHVVLTAHPLQRIGAYALAALAAASTPGELTADQLDVVTDEMTDDAITAATGPSTKEPGGFWLKNSLSFYPNSPMNHPSNTKKSKATVQSDVRRWRARPAPDTWPAVPCVLCGRQAVGFYGKVDVPLAESAVYRNSTPRRHAGTALCWGCVASFHALPYGCHLTGGPAVALHSWDEDFLAWSVEHQVATNRQRILIDRRESKKLASNEVLALQALRRYANVLESGIELMVFSNNNRGQTLDIQLLDRPLAEWLRSTSRSEGRRAGFRSLLQAHRTKDKAGIVGLARNLFRAPERVVDACGSYLAVSIEPGALRPTTTALADICFSYVIEVLRMDDASLQEIRATAQRVATLVAQESAGSFNEFRSKIKQPAQLRAWFRRESVTWLLAPPNDAKAPLITPQAYELLFDPDPDNQAWFHRDLLLIATLDELHRREWRPVGADKALEQLREDADPEDEDFINEQEQQ